MFKFYFDCLILVNNSRLSHGLLANNGCVYITVWFFMGLLQAYYQTDSALHMELNVRYKHHNSTHWEDTALHMKCVTRLLPLPGMCHVIKQEMCHVIRQLFAGNVSTLCRKCVMSCN